MKTIAIAWILVFSVILGGAATADAFDKGARAASAGTVNINTASATQLETLPGIGKVTAQKIIAHRTERGRFSSPDDLVKVKGIGPKTMEKVRSRIAVN